MNVSLPELGWSADFQRQLDIDEIGQMAPARLFEVHRDHVLALTPDGDIRLTLAPDRLTTADVSVGDWVLYTPASQRIERLLERKSLLRRRAAGEDARDQLIAANVDILFITTSMNDDFNPARLERYLALAHGAGVMPVIVLTKADLAHDPAPYLETLADIAPGVAFVALNGTDPAEASALADWCAPGQTAAFLGSSGVGKSTLIAALTGEAVVTQAIREDDAKGRHTTTNRTLYRMREGGWVIDTPGMRALRLHDMSEGIDTVFADLADLANACRFRDCAHDSEPGCAVRAAIEAGEVSEDRLVRWRKLQAEDLHNSETIAQSRARYRAFGKMVRNAKKQKGR